MEREISIILKVKGAEAAKKAIESVFNNSAIGKVTKFTVETQKAGVATQNLGRKARVAGTHVDSFSKSLGKGMAKLYLYNRAWSMFGTQFQEGLQLQRASDQFSLNVGNVSKMLPELRAATRGVVSDFDLLKTAGKAFQLGIKPERMAQTFKMGTVAAQKLGLEASDAINTITNAITKQDEGALNTLGIVTNVNQAYKTQAALIAKNGGVMSNAMSIQLRQSLIMAELNKRFGGANKVQEDGLLILERFKASWKNFRSEIGQTLGIAIIPLTRALTVVLDTVTRILDKLNDNGGFQKFVQLSATLVGIWAGAKFVGSVTNLMRLFGFLKAKETSTGLTVLGSNLGKLGLKARAIQLLKSSLTGLIKTLGLVLSFPTRPLDVIMKLAGMVAEMKSSIMGLVATGSKLLRWSALFSVLTGALGPLWNIVKKVGTAFSVMFQLLNNYDDSTGLSKVLKKDADSLGTWYNRIENFSKIILKAFFYVKAAAIGMFEGLEAAAAPLIQIGKWIGQGFEWAIDAFMGTEKSAVIARREVDNLSESIRKFFKLATSTAAGAAVGASIGSFIPGLGTAVGGVIGAGVGLASGAYSESTRETTPQAPQPQPQASTQVATPTPRTMNLESPDDMPAWARTVIKEMQGQTVIMEADSQKQDIRESQKSAQDRVQIRR